MLLSEKRLKKVIVKNLNLKIIKDCLIDTVKLARYGKGESQFTLHFLMNVPHKSQYKYIFGKGFGQFRNASTFL